ncbi:MAG: sodium-dependent transporter [Simkaniaceae bacterium]|nr:sodium-dependent transporter [Simkaniaceae bacterium]MCF7852260.1 sodium-dependent transporter [Simkaniaceae bacterium]
MKREQWKSKIGFMWAAIGSAVGLGSIWRFPYIVGDSGGGAFVLIFCVCLILVSIPVFLTEVAIGRRTQTSPSGAFEKLGQSKWWGMSGKMTILTGFVVSSFYSVIAGLTLGYVVEALLGHLTHFHNAEQTISFYSHLIMSPWWISGWHFGFMLLSSLILYLGVQKGIESWNKVLMPLLMCILLVLVIKGLTLPGAEKALHFLFNPNLAAITPDVVIMALGQAFFALSLGQGTMVTYGSYLTRKENIPHICLPIASSVIIVSLMAGISIFTIVFSAGMPPASGPDLMFKTLPLIFSQMKGGYFFALLFFMTIFLAGLTSQISAMQPAIAYLCDEKKFSRHTAVILVALGAFLLGIPSALSFGIWKHHSFFGMTFFNFISYVSVNIFVPLGGLLAVTLAGWKWGVKQALDHLQVGTNHLFDRAPVLKGFLEISICFIAPIVIIIILLNLIGII